ncbi:hypothetical protein PtB15_4B544 [Puccinia triticina]|nr:hypothetical protein PtB15_4B544 [Puccinia triticina]
MEQSNQADWEEESYKPTEDQDGLFPRPESDSASGKGHPQAETSGGPRWYWDVADAMEAIQYITKSKITVEQITTGKAGIQRMTALANIQNGRHPKEKPITPKYIARKLLEL